MQIKSPEMSDFLNDIKKKGSKETQLTIMYAELFANYAESFIEPHEDNLNELMDRTWTLLNEVVRGMANFKEEMFIPHAIFSVLKIYWYYGKEFENWLNSIDITNLLNHTLLVDI